MAEERDEKLDAGQDGTDRQPTGQDGQESEFAGHRQEPDASQSQQTMSDQGSEGSFGGQSSGSHSASLGAQEGQPIGCNDTNTGSGTTLSQGADFDAGASSEQNRQNRASGQGFIGSRGSGSDAQIENNGSSSSIASGSSSRATSGSDFASEGRGALEHEDANEPESDRSGSNDDASR